MSAKQKLFSLAASVLMVVAIAPASATVVDFAGLQNYKNYSENGMQMQSTTVWNYPSADMAHMDSGFATFSLISGGDFALTSVQMIANGGSGTARFDAYNNGILVSTTNIAGSAGVFSFAPTFSQIDQFKVSYTNNHFTFDNINFTAAAVPEPTTVALLGLGLLGFAASRRKAAKK